MESKSTMKHVHLNGFGDPSVLTIQESEIPKPKENEVLLRIKASALNRADTIQRKGLYPAPPGASNILGLEAAGYICNPDGTCDESKKVMALLSGGGCSQYCVVPKGHVMEVPKNISLEDAGGLPEVWLTAFLLLELAQIKPKDKVLIYAGASGVGTAAIQLVKFYEATSIVTISTDEKAEFTKKLGASAAINYKKEENVAQAVLNATDGKGVDIILDCVGQSFYNVGVEASAMDARWILYGTMSGTKVPNFDFRDFMKKRLSLITSTLRSRSVDYKTGLIERFKTTILPHFESGKFQVHAEKVIKIDWTDVKPIREAHEMMENNANTGKIIFSFE